MFSPINEPVNYRSGKRNRRPVLYAAFADFLKGYDPSLWYSTNGETKSKLRAAAKAHGYSLAFATSPDGTVCFRIIGPYRQRNSSNVNERSNSN